MSDKRRSWKRTVFRALAFLVIASLLAIGIRVGYSLTESGKSSRLLHALIEGDDTFVDGALVKVGLVPPLPHGDNKDLLILDTLKSIRQPTLDEYAAMLSNDRVRYQARVALQEAGDSRAIRPLLLAQRDGTAFDNELPDLWTKCGDGPFVDLLSDTDVSIRADVLDFLGRVHPHPDDTSLNAAVKPLLRDCSPRVRIAAAEFLVTRASDEARSVLLAEFRRMARDENEELAWEQEVRHGQMSVDDMLALRAQFGRVRGILQRLSLSGDAEVADILQDHDRKQALAQDRAHAAALAKTYSPGDGYWRLYILLVPEPPNLGYYSPKIGAARDLEVSPPYIVPTSNSVQGKVIEEEFGPADQVTQSVTWQIRWGDEKMSLTGDVWKFGADLEVLLVSGEAKAAKTTRPDARTLFGGLVPETKAASSPRDAVQSPE